ncbi:hypothetical protein HK100_012657 [Physocladia obscura]|uniref:Uncharacterized protein n=1 Tax=Physocladia obscura TaxID=109957 RepID=A0AAD5SZH3_9FUNG|nr:hypothetical protein HK100_012657 [Physocladia obscura]
MNVELFDEPVDQITPLAKRAKLSHALLYGRADSWFDASNNNNNTPDINGFGLPLATFNTVATTSSTINPAQIDSRRPRIELFTHIFVPAFQSIISLVLIVRVPVILASVGLLQTILIALCATLLTLLTAVSIAIVGSGSWIRTNPDDPEGHRPKPKYAGVYFLISKSLGKVVGGGMSILFYTGIVVGAALPANTIANFTITLDNSRSVFSFSSDDNVRVLAGSSRANELNNPRRDIPRFTIAAQITTSIIYFLVIIILSVAFDRDSLAINQLNYFDSSAMNGTSNAAMQSNYLMVAVAWPSKWIAVAGAFGIAFGAGIQGFTSAVKLLKAIAKDDLLPILCVFKNSESDNRLSLLLKNWEARVLGFVLAEIALLAGNTDTISQFVTITFLICYFFLNASAAVLRYIKSPNWNPMWKFHWSIPGAASLLSLIFAFLISLPLTLVILFVLGGIIKLAAYYDARQQYGAYGAGTASGILLQMAKRNLWEVEIKDGEHMKGSEWKPHIMLFVKGNDAEIDDKVNQNDDLEWKMEKGNGIEFLAQLKRAGGLAIICTLLLGDIENLPPTFNKMDTIRTSLLQEVRKYNLMAFPQVLLSSTINSGILASLQSTGIGPLRPNTAMLGWPTAMTASFTHLMRGIILLDKAVLLVKGLNDLPISNKASEKPVDLFWMLADGGIMMLITQIIMKHPSWRKSRLRIFVIAHESDAESHERMKINLHATLKGLRIKFDVADVLVIDGKLLNEPPGSDSKDLGREESFFSMWEPTDIRVTDTLTVATSDVRGNRSSKFGTETFDLRAARRHSTVDSILEEESVDSDFEERNSQHTDLREIDAICEARVQLAFRVNSLMKVTSGDSRLIICNLPSPGHHSTHETYDWNYVEYLQVLTQGINHIMFVRGTNSGVVTEGKFSSLAIPWKSTSKVKDAKIKKSIGFKIEEYELAYDKYSDVFQKTL